MSCKTVRRGNATEADATDFRAQVTEFLDGVALHDGPPFFKHLRRDQFVLSILPGDRVIDDYDDYLAFQNRWNDKRDAVWSYQFELLHLWDPARAFAVILATYEDNDASGKRFKRLLRIKDDFVKIDGTWFMTVNQNTLVDG